MRNTAADLEAYVTRMLILLVLLPMSKVLFAQDLKSLAAKEVEQENYARAVTYLEKAVDAAPNDADAWYRLGHTLHWMAYDSAPLPGFDEAASDRILACMRKALELDAGLRDCYSVICSEYGDRAEHQLQLRNSVGFLEQLRLGQREGGYPPWLLEYARNVLQSCAPHAVLFAGGDADVFPMWYSQFVDGFRTDVTVAPVGLLDRPWFLLLLRSGLDSTLQPVEMPWTEDQIMDLHLSKWLVQSLGLPITAEARRRFTVTDSVLQWRLIPDLQRGSRSLLSINAIVMRGILEENRWRRPVHFSLACQVWMTFGLEDFFQLHALTNELVSFPAKSTGRTIDLEATVPFLTTANNFQDLRTLKAQDIPYLSAPVNNYRALALRTCDTLLSRHEYQLAHQVFEAMESNIPKDALPIPAGWQSEIEQMRARIRKQGL